MAHKAIIVTDISYGDAGKGTTVDFLVREASSAVVIRHSGGAQAAHNVHLADGTHHTFSQFGSGSLVPGTRTHLSRYMLINPLNMFTEANALIRKGFPDIWERTTVDGDALVITPWQISANRLRELSRGKGAHGSCGQGVGETASDGIRFPDEVIRVRDLTSPRLCQKLEVFRLTKYEDILHELMGTMPIGVAAKMEWDVFSDDRMTSLLASAYKQWAMLVSVVDAGYLETLERQHELMVFEGAQGVLLDEWHGFHPYTTWSTTTHDNALTMLDEIDFQAEVTRLGVMRAYTTRHGAGPMVTEDARLTAQLPDTHNDTGRWQGGFRVGHLDLVAHQYALNACNGADGLVVTGLDRLAPLTQWLYCPQYDYSGGADAQAELFDSNVDGNVIGIKPSSKGDLARQERLTNALLSSSPRYSSVDLTSNFPADADHLLHLIEDSFGIPVTLASYGPTADAKRALSSLVC
jgi:adenylosuccinate synthase